MMRDERPEASLFIGLHKLAEQNGDGLVPELYALLTQDAPAPDMTNVVTFPADRRGAFPDASPGASPDAGQGASPDAGPHPASHPSARILAFRR